MNESKMSLRRSNRRSAATENSIEDNMNSLDSGIESNDGKRRKSGKQKREDMSDMDIDTVSSTSSLKQNKRSNKRSRMNSDAYDSSSTVYESSIYLDENSKPLTDDSLNSASTTDKRKNPFGKRKKEYVGEPPLNLNDYEKPFKNAKYSTPKKYKLLKQILMMDKNKSDIPVDAPLYLNIEAPPSVYPRKKYCDITGLKSIYTDPKSGLRYYDSTVYKYIQEQTQSTLQGYLGLRNAAVNLK